ncbi:hypothetical protein GJU40_19665 [Bacillus lacus]|uniref:LURP-one-related family protein n=1 Tax=Metabacillus lacus TaxID=1983721 RepID=A0A7X2J2U4_9BACI|nr:hypothetical protein [Metabacillus lacus]MRX74340.1 hypothetical protein [Metabacillus lacus]
MNQDRVYFSENFFSAGKTDIYDVNKEKIGELDLRSMFTSSVDVVNHDGEVVVSGRFPFLSNKWKVYDELGAELGTLREKFTLLSKNYEYHAYERGYYTIDSELFSRQYRIEHDSSDIGEFKLVSSFFSSPVFELKRRSNELSTSEMVAVVMGVHAIQKRKRQGNASAAGGPA